MGGASRWTVGNALTMTLTTAVSWPAAESDVVTVSVTSTDAPPGTPDSTPSKDVSAGLPTTGDAPSTAPGNLGRRLPSATDHWPWIDDPSGSYDRLPSSCTPTVASPTAACITTVSKRPAGGRAGYSGRSSPIAATGGASTHTSTTNGFSAPSAVTSVMVTANTVGPDTDSVLSVPLESDSSTPVASLSPTARTSHVAVRGCPSGSELPPVLSCKSSSDNSPVTSSRLSVAIANARSPPADTVSSTMESLPTRPRNVSPAADRGMNCTPGAGVRPTNACGRRMKNSANCGTRKRRW